MYLFKIPFPFHLEKDIKLCLAAGGGWGSSISFCGTVVKVGLIECSHGNSPAWKDPLCSKKPSALPAQDANLFAAGPLSD